MQSRHWVLLIVILLLVLWLLQKQEPKQTDKQSINTVTLLEPESNQSPEVKGIDQTVDKANGSEQPNTQPSPTGHAEKQNQRTYLQVYRDLQLAHECRPFYNKHHQSQGQIDYINEINQDYSYQEQTDKQAPARQIAVLEFFIEQCLQLKQQTFDRAKIYEEFPKYQLVYPVIDELNQELKRTKPFTEAEKHLAEVMLKAEVWGNKWRRLVKILQGEFQLSEAERAVLTQEMSRLMEQISYLYETNPENDQEIERLNNEHQSLYDQTESRLPVDQVALEQAQAEFDPINQQLNDMLSTTYPDSFSHAFQTLQQYNSFHDALSHKSRIEDYKHMINHPFSWPIDPKQMIQAEAGFADESHFSLMIVPAGLLYLCYLGEDCGPNSIWSRKYCLNMGEFGFYDFYEDACGKDLIDFYTDDYLTQNQWLDVSALFESMVAMYAK